MQHVPRGFTLLELMVVLVIIGICTAGIGLGLGSLLDPARQLRQGSQNDWRSAHGATRPASMAAPALAGRRRRLPVQQARRHPLVDVQRDDRCAHSRSGGRHRGAAGTPVELSPEWIGVAWGTDVVVAGPPAASS